MNLWQIPLETLCIVRDTNGPVYRYFVRIGRWNFQAEGKERVTFLEIVTAD